MYSLKITAMVRGFLSTVRGKIFTWYHTLLLARRFTLPAQMLEDFVGSFSEKYKDYDCLSKSTDSLHTPLYPGLIFIPPFLSLHKYCGVLLPLSGKAQENGEET